MIIQQCNGEGDKEMLYNLIEAFYDWAVFLMHDHDHDQADVACSLFSLDLFIVQEMRLLRIHSAPRQ